MNRIRSGENEIEPIEEFKARLLLDKFHAEFGICARLIRSTVKDPENPEEKDFLTSIEEIDFLKRCYWSADKELVDKVEYQIDKFLDYKEEKLLKQKKYPSIIRWIKGIS